MHKKNDGGVYAESQAADMPLSTAIKHLYDAQKYPGLPPEFLSWRSLFLTLYTGANNSVLSAKSWDKDEIMLGGGNHIMQDGYEPIVKGHAENLTIKLNQCATDITYHGDAVPEPTGFLMTCWSEDPYTLGSYSYIPVGASILM
jgi:hypothetical protein